MRTRRQFLATVVHAGLLSHAGGSVGVAAPSNTLAKGRNRDLHKALGLVTSSFDYQLVGEGIGRSFSLLEVPRILRGELDLSVIDLNSKFLSSTDNAYLEKLRTAAERAGCIISNLKINRGDNLQCDIGSHDKSRRQEALQDFKAWIDVASRLGTRWARPHPGHSPPDSASALVDGLRELSDYGAGKNIELLVENVGCIGRDDPHAIPAIVKAVGRNIAGSPDIGNWPNDDIRFAALESSFPVAATCDFKFNPAPDGSHPRYDLKRCFMIGWTAGFRGPWNFEHRDHDTAALLRKLSAMRRQVREWITEAEKI